MHPQPRVRFVVGVCTRVFTAEAPETSGIPHAMVLTAYIVLSPGTGPGTGRSCPRRSRDKPATLTPASGRQDHTTSPSASAPPVLRRRRVHRSPPHARDDRETPLLVRRDDSLYSCFYLAVKQNSEIQKLMKIQPWGCGEAEYFLTED
jgi:hypothetical protein